MVVMPIPPDPYASPEPENSSDGGVRGPPRWVVVGGTVGVVLTILWVALHHGAFASHRAAEHHTNPVQP